MGGATLFGWRCACEEIERWQARRGEVGGEALLRGSGWSAERADSVSAVAVALTGVARGGGTVGQSG